MSISLPPSYNYIIYKSGSGYYAKKYDGTDVITGGSTSPEEVFQATFDSSPPLGPGIIYVQSGDYDFSNTFSGLDLQSRTRLILDPTARLRVFNGYGGHVFRLQCTNNKEVNDCLIDGGIISEIGDENSPYPNDHPKRRWTGILLQASTNNPPDQTIRGLLFNKFQNSTIYNANYGIHFLVDGNSGWINANSFQFLKLWRNNIFINFEMTSQWPGGQNIGIYRNHFDNLECQSGENTTYGIKDIRHRGNSFFDVKIWDINKGGPNAVTSSIHPDDSHTIIIGGIMTNQNFTYDPLRQTKIFDEWQGLRS